MKASTSSLNAASFAPEYPERVASVPTSSTSSTPNPRSRVRRLCSVRTNSPAPITSSSDSATCATTRVEPRRPCDMATRPPLAMDAPGATREACHAGAAPNTSVVAVAIEQRHRHHRPVRRQVQGDAARPVEPLAGRHERHQRAASRPGDREAGDGTGDGDQRAFGEQLADDARAAGADRQPHRDFTLAGGATRQQQVGHVHARDQQDEDHERHGNLQRHAELRSHEAGAGSARDHGERFRQPAAAFVLRRGRRQRRFEPLRPQHADPRLELFAREAGLRPRQNAQPARARPEIKRLIGPHHRPRLDRECQVRRFADVGAGKTARMRLRRSVPARPRSGSIGRSPGRSGRTAASSRHR